MIKKTILIILFFIAGILAYLNKDFLLDHESILNAINNTGPWAPVIFCLIYIVAAIVFFPASFITILSGVIFGLKLGLVYALIGTVLASCFSFIVARYLAGNLIKSKSGSMLEKVQKGVEEGGWHYLAFMRLIPIFPFNVLNYVFGLSSMRLWVFTLTTAITALPLTFSYAYLGYAGEEVAKGDSGSFIKLGIVLAVLILISFLTKFVKKKE